MNFGHPYYAARPAAAQPYADPSGVLHGPMAYEYGAAEQPAPLIRKRATEAREYRRQTVTPIDEPARLYMKGAKLPTEQKGWALVGPQLYHSKSNHAFVLEIQHHCGQRRYFSRAAWLTGARDIGRGCKRCYRPGRHQKQVGQLGRKRRVCDCGEPIPPQRSVYCSPACSNNGKCAETIPQMRRP